MTPTPEQQRLIESITRVLSGDGRIQSAWLTGSFGRGEADRFSDIDVAIVVPDEWLEAMVCEYAGDLGAIADVVHTQTLAGRVVNAVTRDWLRFDLSFFKQEEIARVLSGGALLLFNMGAPIEPEARSRTPHRPSAQRIRALVDEFLRVLGLASVGLGREEYILLEDGAGLLRKMTIDLMLEKNGVGPADRGGALRLNSYLTPDQRAALEAMPPLSADRDSAIAVHQALARIFLPLAKNLASEIGAEWPSAFEDATRRSLRERLGIEI